MRGKEDNEQRIAQGVRVLRAREGEYGENTKYGHIAAAHLCPRRTHNCPLRTSTECKIEEKAINSPQHEMKRSEAERDFEEEDPGEKEEKAEELTGGAQQESMNDEAGLFEGFAHKWQKESPASKMRDIQEFWIEHDENQSEQPS